MSKPVPFDDMPYIQIDTNTWAVMRYPKDRPVAIILMLSNRDNVPQYFVQTWHPDPGKRRVIGQYDTLQQANESVLWDLSVVDRAQRERLEAAYYTSQTGKSPLQPPTQKDEKPQGQ